MKKEAANLSWQAAETRVKEIASYLWNSDAEQETIAGVKCDCIIKFRPDYYIAIEITENDSLTKIREDIAKLHSVKHSLNAKNIYCECYIVTTYKPTDSMKITGNESFVNVLAITDFENKYFDYGSYVYGRSKLPFGSLLVEPDVSANENHYINVKYITLDESLIVTIDTIASALRNRKKVILLGHFGTGKSCCVKQLFNMLSEKSESDYIHAFAINLREHWGAKRGKEIIDRHLADIGMSPEQFSKSYYRENNIYLLDGFDEIGTQSWGTDITKMQAMRANSVVAIKDLLSTVKGGVLITGREHFFNSDNEMYSAFGLDPQSTLLIRCKEEFDDSEALQYITENNKDAISGTIEIPEWLPKRPLIMQLALRDAPELFYANLSITDECDFWYHFLDKLCEREAKINPLLNPATIKHILIRLGRLTRNKARNVGPISTTELAQAFEVVTGNRPNDESLIMLQRLPGIGRVDADSPDRQFIDTFILNGLRAEDIIQSVLNGRRDLLNENWQHPMNLEGCTILAQYIDKDTTRAGIFLSFAKQAGDRSNQTLAGDIFGSLLLTNLKRIDFKNLHITEANLSHLSFDSKDVCNFTLKNCFIETIDTTNSTFSGQVQLADCLIVLIWGIPSESGLPKEFNNCTVENFQTLATVSRINRAKLSEAHKILVTIIKKTFFQPGRGRKEEALLRGLGTKEASKTSEKILNKLLEEDILKKHKGDEGWIYSPVRKHAGRMQNMMSKLTASDDPVWIFAGTL